MQYTVRARRICSITIKKKKKIILLLFAVIGFANVHYNSVQRAVLISFEHVIIIQSHGLGHDGLSMIKEVPGPILSANIICHVFQLQS